MARNAFVLILHQFGFFAHSHSHSHRLSHLSHISHLSNNSHLLLFYFDYPVLN